MCTNRLSFPVFLLVLSVTVGQAQDIPIKNGDVPKAVLEAFRKSYPNATIKGTFKEQEHGVTYYEIESIDGAVHRDLLYKNDGTVTEIEEGIEPGSLPAEVKTALKKLYPKYKVTKAEKTTIGSVINISVQIAEQKKHREVVFDANWKVVKDEIIKAKKEKKEDDEDEENDEDDDNL